MSFNTSSDIEAEEEGGERKEGAHVRRIGDPTIIVGQKLNLLGLNRNPFPPVPKQPPAAPTRQ